MGKEYGDPIRHDPNFNGPTKNRSCTDIIFLIAFILYLGVWICIGAYSLTYGSVQQFVAPTDSNEKRCGIDSGLEDRPYLLDVDIRTLPDSVKVCVKTCPSQTIIFAIRLDPFENWKSSIVCTDDVNMGNLTKAAYEQYVKEKKCTAIVFKSQPVLGRCFANFTEVGEVIKSSAADLGGQNEMVQKIADLFKFDQILDDLIAAKWYMVGALGAVVVICFLYILLLRWIITPLVWSSIVGLLALLGYALYVCYTHYMYYRSGPVNVAQTSNWFTHIFTKHETWLAMLIVLGVILVILLLILIFLRSRISLALALIQEGSRAITAVKSTVFFPILPWIMQCLVIGYGVVVLIHLSTIQQPTYKLANLAADQSCVCNGAYQDSASCNPDQFRRDCYNNDTSQSANAQPCRIATCQFTGNAPPPLIPYIHVGNLLGMFWAQFFVSGVADMILASTFSTWYWTLHKKDVPLFTLTSGIYRTTRYHLGTVAFGALIIAIVRVIRVILAFIDCQAKKFNNPVSRCIMCFCKCFFWCLESFMKFINKNAYIMCAINGKNFCRSASDAFSLLMRNIIRVVVLDKVTDFIFFLSKILISLGVGVGVYYLLDLNFVYDMIKGERLNHQYIPAIILCIATYLICTIFFNVYSMAVDTLFLCFLEDSERNDGSPEKPYYMSKNLMKILGRRNMKPKKAED